MFLFGLLLIFTFAFERIVMPTFDDHLGE